MAEVLRSVWPASELAGLSRRDRRSCLYDAYVPDPLSNRLFQLDGDVAADVTEAESAIARLNVEAAVLTNTEILARLLLRAESIASSRIEGLEVGGRRLLTTELSRKLGERPRDITAAEVLANVDAMSWAVRSIPTSEPISPADILEIHRRLLAGTRLSNYAGRLREVQNWIGGSSLNPCSAAFVPPPPELVPDLLSDLCAFCNDDSLPAVVQAALVHAQFETIHPFVDGNGRTGRALIHLVLLRRGLTPRVLPPVSLILATRAADYIEALTRTRYLGLPDSREAHAGFNHWVALFAVACKRAAEDAASFERRIQGIQEDWRRRLAPVRRDSALDLLIEALPGLPLLTVNGAAELIGRSFQAANEAIVRFTEVGVLSRLNLGSRNRAFEARDIVDAFTQFERQLASPAGDTSASPRLRPVPSRARRKRRATAAG